eukprot:637137-Rhodomonas_salina.2
MTPLFPQKPQRQARWSSFLESIVAGAELGLPQALMHAAVAVPVFAPHHPAGVRTRIALCSRHARDTQAEI